VATKGIANFLLLFGWIYTANGSIFGPISFNRRQEESVAKQNSCVSQTGTLVTTTVSTTKAFYNKFVFEKMLLSDTTIKRWGQMRKQIIYISTRPSSITIHLNQQEIICNRINRNDSTHCYLQGKYRSLKPNYYIIQEVDSEEPTVLHAI
jgi:hypothetical protein